jgi:membrane-associated protease RseP (regulator of RpoE activity)
MYDLILLGIFIIAVAAFLIRKRENLKREGLLFLYRTSWGIKFINYVGKKYKRTMAVLCYVSVVLGYVLMVSMVYLFYTVIKLYLFRPDVVSAIRVPPIMPLIPYIDKFVPFLPPFYFTFWIVILAVIAISHEFAHGIFAAYEKVKIKKTGFGFFPFFLPVFLAAFVELDEKKMAKKKKFKQMAILSAGTFANIVTSLFFLAILWGFFVVAFTPAGVVFDDYSYSVVPVSDINMVNGVLVVNPTYESLTNLVKNATLNDIEAGGRDYVGVKGFNNDKTQVALYDDAPAINSEMNGAITEIGGGKVRSLEELSAILSKYDPGDEVIIETVVDGETKNYEIVLGENPTKPGSAWVGIGFVNAEQSFMGKIFSVLSSFKGTNIYYESKIGEFGWFLYNLLWWLIIIGISVALVNMLPIGIFDGGRFFYLTVLAVTKSEKAARNTYKILTKLFLLILLAIMVVWAYVIFFK